MDRSSSGPAPLDLPDAPAIPGLTFRHFRDADDYPGILAVNNGSKLADGQDHSLFTLESFQHIYDTTPNHDLTRDLLIAEVAGDPVAYSRVFWDRELAGGRVYWHVSFVLPPWRGRGIDRALLGWITRRAREMDALQPEAEPAYLSSEIHAGMTGQETLLQAEGYTPVRFEFHMETPNLDAIPDVPMPAGLEVRPARPEDYRAIWEASLEAFRDHWGAGEAEEQTFDSWIADPETQPALWVVAWDGDQVAGSILNYINHDMNTRLGRRLGYTESISVRRPWRRRGLARALLARSMALLRAQGMTQTALGVDTENPSGALQLYESMGYQVVSRSTTYRKPLAG